ncbi:MAG: hypothetical protein GY941_19135, partial [Planctomycetes bacterium]|nr:hypothetical protein [Planctomycetota bacterium]
RYWISEETGGEKKKQGSDYTSLSPLLHQNTSTLENKLFTSKFAGDELFLNDHQVRSEKALSEAVYLETNRETVGNASGESEEGTLIGLQSMVPVWDPIPPGIEGSIRVSREIKVLLLGANKHELDWIRRSYPNTSPLKLYSQSTVEEIQEKLKESSFDHLVWIAPQSSQTTDSHSLIEQQEKGVLEVFRIIKAIISLGYAVREIEWTIITSNTQLVKKRDSIEADHAGLLGLIGSLAKEFPHWRLRLL